MTKDKIRGFTVIELIIVIAVIGIISTMALVSLNKSQARSRDARRVADIKQMRVALDLYQDTCGQYPSLADTPSVDFLTTDLFNDKCPIDITLGKYMANIPVAPLPLDGGCTLDQNSYDYKAFMAGGNPCTAVSDECVTYSLSYCLGGASNNISAGHHLANPASME